MDPNMTLDAIFDELSDCEEDRNRATALVLALDAGQRALAEMVLESMYLDLGIEPAEDLRLWIRRGGFLPSL